MVEYDEAIFLDVAHNIQRSGLPVRSIGANGVFYFEHTSLYPYLLNLYATNSSNEVFLARMMTTLFSLSCVLLVYSIGKQVNGNVAGFLSALLVGINPFWTLYSFFVCMEIPMTFFMLIGLLIIVKSKQGKSLLAAGVALGVAVLLKEVALLFVGICGIYALLKFRHDRRLMWKAPLYVVVPAVIAVLAWGIWCWALAPSAFASTMLRWVGSTIGPGVRDPRMSLTPIQWVNRIIFDLLDWPLAVSWLLALIVWLACRRRRLLDCVLLGYPVSAIGLSFAFRLKEPRHLIGILPMIALFVGYNVDWTRLWKWAQGRRARGIIGAIAISIFLLFASPLRLPLHHFRHLNAWIDPLYAWRIFENDRYYNVLRMAGLYLQERTEPDEVVTVLHEATV
ncbi:MAG: ArnT family glycosyltransferase, partial [Anaerolineae bacterium]